MNEKKIRRKILTAHYTGAFINLLALASASVLMGFVVSFLLIAYSDKPLSLTQFVTPLLYLLIAALCCALVLVLLIMGIIVCSHHAQFVKDYKAMPNNQIRQLGNIMENRSKKYGKVRAAFINIFGRKRSKIIKALAKFGLIVFVVLLL